jgi:fructokinase
MNEPPPLPPGAPTVLCFGEVLWDFLPEGLFAGGAPANVAVHLRRHGVHALLLSGVGRDTLGDELLRRLRLEDLDTTLVLRSAGLPTGHVLAAVGPGGDARYEIMTSVAWDQILIGEDAVRAAAGARALVFGSLALRSALNRNSLERLLAVLPPHAERVFDVNLRPPHDDLALVHEFAPRSTLLKVNADEAARLARGSDAAAVPGLEEADARVLHARTGCTRICVTAGAHGAGLLHQDRWTWEPGQPVAVADTVGAGDAFLASLVTHLLDGRSSDGELLARACRLGEFVASRRGATPAYDPSLTARPKQPPR